LLLTEVGHEDHQGTFGIRPQPQKAFARDLETGGAVPRLLGGLWQRQRNPTNVGFGSHASTIILPAPTR